MYSFVYSSNLKVHRFLINSPRAATRRYNDNNATSMGKVKAKRRSTPAKSAPPSQGQTHADSPSSENGAMDRKPIATQNEAVLTSKNFRLARELVSFYILRIIFPYSSVQTSWRIYSHSCVHLWKQNELRIKHRDETKIARQLTMDNVSTRRPYRFYFISALEGLLAAKQMHLMQN